MDKNPFSLYDFLGYVVPGALSIFSIYLIFAIVKVDASCFFEYIFNIEFWNKSIFPQLSVFIKWNNFIVLVLLSYVLGHLLSYLSSITIERFAVWSYGYPTVFLTQRANTTRYVSLKNISRYRESKWRTIIVTIRGYGFRLVLFVLLLPISLCSVILGQFLGLKYVVVKEFNDSYKKMLHQQLVLFNENKLNGLMDNSKLAESDIHRCVYHYYYEKNEGHREKLDNYVALYGFLRSMTLLFNLVTVFYIAVLIFNRNLTYTVNTMLIAVLLVAVCYLFYLDYLKFYRRFTVEVYMCLMTDNLKNENTHNRN